MRCPHCAGEIPQASRFCGICGRSVTEPPGSGRALSISGGQGDAGSLSLFELPASRKGRAARVFIVLALDAMLAAAGIAMIVAYARARSTAIAPSTGDEDAGVTAEVKVLPPTPVRETADGVTSPPPVTDRAARAAPARDRATGKPTPVRLNSARPASTEVARADVLPPATAVPEVEPAAPAPEDEPGTADPAPATEPDDEEMSRLAARIELVVTGHQGQIQRCYSQAAKVTTPEDPLEGKIDVRFSVMPDGSASNVRVARNTSGSPSLGSCLAGLVESWTFPAPGAEPVDFIWPFQFSAPRNK